MKPLRLRYDPKAPGRTTPGRCVSPAVVEHALERLCNAAACVAGSRADSARVPASAWAELQAAVLAARAVVKRCEALR